MLNDDEIDRLLAERYLSELPGASSDVPRFLANAEKHLAAAVVTLELGGPSLSMAYSAFVDCGLAWLASQELRLMSRPGHHRQLAGLIEISFQSAEISLAARVFSEVRKDRNRHHYEGEDFEARYAAWILENATAFFDFTRKHLGSD